MFQEHGSSVKNRANLRVLQAWLDEKMFQEVRTKDQLGYKVQVNFVENAGIYGISFLI